MQLLVAGFGSPQRAAIAIAVVAWCAATAAVFTLRLATSEALSAISGISLAVAALGAGVGGVLRARSVTARRTRAAWGYLGAAASAWGLGQVVTVTYEIVLHRDVPFPSLADVGYLSAVPLFAAGLLRLAVPDRNLTSRLRAILDGLLISTALLLASWVGVLGPITRLSEETFVSKSFLLAYPIGDVIIVTLIAYVVRRTRLDGVRPTVPLGLIGVALVSFSVADSGYAYLSLTDGYTSGNVIDTGWLCGFVALLVASLRVDQRSDDDGASGAGSVGMLLPYIVIVAAVGFSMAIIEFRGRTDSTAAWIRSLLIMLIIIRQVLALSENARLTRHLERRVADRTAELQASQERFRALVEHSSDVVSLIRPDGEIVYQSESSNRVLGLDWSELVGRSFFQLLDESSQEVLRTASAEVSKRPLGVAPVELRLMHGDGGWRQVETIVTNLLDEPAVGGLVLNTRDVSERRQLERQLAHQAFHDSLTGLANRALFLDRVSHALQRRTSQRSRVGILFLDLDGFKEVNDSLGHAFGDRLLVEVAQRLLECVRSGDTVARLGGDEFAVLVESDDFADDILQLAERIRASAQTPYILDGKELFVQGSIGVATADPGMRDAGQLIRNADLAMYQAKANPDQGFARYDPTMHSTLMDKLELEADLRKAVHARGLHVHYQPQHDISTGELVGVEALLRWTHCQRGDVGPAVFIPLAEQSGLIHELGRYVLEEACRQGARWRELAPQQPLDISVNISGRQLLRPGFVEEVADLLQASGLPAQCLTLEVTESILMGDADESSQVLLALKDIGVKVAIDDFGTGYSSLSYLHRFPVDVLKIDRSFIEQLSDPSAQQGLVQSIVQLGQTLNLQTVAEGIEDVEQLAALRRLECGVAQGYHFGRPGPAEQISSMLTGRGGPAVAGAAPGEPVDEPADEPAASGRTVPAPRGATDAVPRS